ncbi:uncharacterized protein LOC120336614 [Styela clava]
MESEAFHKFAQVASTTGADVLQFENCNLTREKLNAFAQGATDFGLKIKRFVLSDKTMESEAFCKFAQVASTTGADVVQFENCNLTREKLNAFAQGATDFGLKSDHLILIDKTMESEAFCKFAQVASTTGADVVQFENCNLTREKLNAFAQGATDLGLKINHFVLFDKTMDSEAFHKFAQVASTTGADLLQFSDCNLTREKMNAFAQGATDFGLKIKRFVLSDKTMESEAFHKFAEVASTTGADGVLFSDCNLTNEKLNAFAQGATDFGLKINHLKLIDKTMESEAFHEVAQVASTAEADIVEFENCNLTREKLNAFAQGATDSGLKVRS